MPEKKESNEKPAQKKPEGNGDKKPLHKEVVHHTKKFLKMSITIPVVIVVILLVLALWKVPYQAQESYVEVQERQVQHTETVVDYDNPVVSQECTPVAGNVRIEDEVKAYGKPYGLNGFKCYAQFKVRNNGETDGKWSYRYLFNINGKIIATEPEEYLIPKISAITYNFETDQCKQGDSIGGTYELVSSPFDPTCVSTTSYNNKTVTTYETVQDEVPKERIVTKYESLWANLFGLNKNEKV